MSSSCLLKCVIQVLRLLCFFSAEYAFHVRQFWERKNLVYFILIYIFTSFTELPLFAIPQKTARWMWIDPNHLVSFMDFLNFCITKVIVTAVCSEYLDIRIYSYSKIFVRFWPAEYIQIFIWHTFPFRIYSDIHSQKFQSTNILQFTM